MSCFCQKHCDCSMEKLQKFPQQIQNIQPFLNLFFQICPVKLTRQQLLTFLLAITQQHNRLPFKLQSEATKNTMKQFLILSIRIFPLDNDYKEKVQQIIQGQKQQTVFLRIYEPFVRSFFKKLTINCFLKGFKDILHSPYKKQIQESYLFIIYWFEACISLFFFDKPSKYDIKQLSFGVFLFSFMKICNVNNEQFNFNSIKQYLDTSKISFQENKIRQIVKNIEIATKEGNIENILIDKDRQIKMFLKNQQAKISLKKLYNRQIQRQEFQQILPQSSS